MHTILATWSVYVIRHKRSRSCKSLAFLSGSQPARPEFLYKFCVGGGSIPQRVQDRPDFQKLCGNTAHSISTQTTWISPRTIIVVARTVPQSCNKDGNIFRAFLPHKPSLRKRTQTRRAPMPTVNALQANRLWTQTHIFSLTCTLKEEQNKNLSPVAIYSSSNDANVPTKTWAHFEYVIADIWPNWHK